jgi:SEC-C motif
MDTNNRESADTQTAADEAGAKQESIAFPTAAVQRDEPSASALVIEMIESGEWPAPELLERIVNAGDAAVEPLVALLRIEQFGWPEDAPIVNAIGLLSMLRPPAAVPELLTLARRSADEDIAHQAAEALISFGAAGFDALVELCAEPSINGYSRASIADAGVAAAGDDPVRRSRLAEVLRANLEDRISAARKELSTTGFLEKHSPDDADGDDEEFDDEADDFFDEDDQVFDQDHDFDDDELLAEAIPPDEAELPEEAGVVDDLAPHEQDPTEQIATPEEGKFGILKIDDGEGPDPDDLDDDLIDEEEDQEVEPSIAEEVAFVVGHLADLADPSAAILIETAFSEGLVDETITDREFVDERYATGGKTAEEDEDWLSVYRYDYQSHLDKLMRRSTSSRPKRASPQSYDDEDFDDDYDDEDDVYEDDDRAPLPPPIAPIRNLEPKLGRNELCWCGSGKKYKKCHLGKDALT